MSTQIGRLINIGFALESERGAAENAAAIWQPKVDFDFNPRTEYAINESGLGIIDGRSDAKVVEKLSEVLFMIKQWVICWRLVWVPGQQEWYQTVHILIRLLD